MSSGVLRGLDSPRSAFRRWCTPQPGTRCAWTMDQEDQDARPARKPVPPRDADVTLRPTRQLCVGPPDGRRRRDTSHVRRAPPARRRRVRLRKSGMGNESFRGSYRHDSRHDTADTPPEPLPTRNTPAPAACASTSESRKIYRRARAHGTHSYSSRTRRPLWRLFAACVPRQSHPGSVLVTPATR